MPETTYICLDTSEFMRNGDYTPTRMAAQYDAAAMLITAKLNDNPEAKVGLLAFGGGAEGRRGTAHLLAAPTDDAGKLLAALTHLRPEGATGIVAGIKTAMVCVVSGLGVGWGSYAFST